ncbi:hypothetical protein D4764_15G0003380 [Takifugu flavidus]|uniref:Uncharacterized protein n=1 Tax=Takifugu flavidus TaxID=433684 RepID=A0A5C6NZI2_9TELE|nr:hypothetical protein D4764_15G0003380 [Takifugu flavidus]
MEVAKLEGEKQELVTRIKDCELRIYDLFEDNQLMATKCENSNSTIQQLVAQNLSSVTSNEINNKVLQEVLNDNKELKDIVNKLAATVSELEYANNHLEEKSRTLMQKYEKAEADIQKLDDNFQKQVMIINQSLTQVQYLEKRNEEVTKRYEISQREVHQLQKLNKDLAITTENSAELVKLLYRKSQELVQKLEVPGSRLETPPKVLENKQAKILWDFQIQSDKMVVANQPDIGVGDKHQKTVVVVASSMPAPLVQTVAQAVAQIFPN